MASRKPDCFANQAASPVIQWFFPADWDMDDTHADAECVTGWYWKDPSKIMFWHGPFNTSQDAADALAKAVTILGTAHRIAPCVPVTVYGNNGVHYVGTYYKSTGDFARIRKAKRVLCGPRKGKLQ